MDYHTCLDYLYGLGHETLTMKLGLATITQLMEEIGDVHQTYPIVHVAGTNGKGSFCAMLATVLVQAGIKTGLFTSPHLVKIEERVQVDLTPISQTSFCDLMAELKSTIEQLLVNGRLMVRPTFFEHVTALALNYFHKASISIAILEVGLGGRLDSTNIVEPLLSVITPIDFDHQQYLGNTLAAIANEKAGIIKPSTPLLVSVQLPEAREVISKRAKDLSAPLQELNLATLHCHYCEDGYYSFDLLTPYHHYQNVRVGLRGRHQVETAALVVMAAEYLSTLGFSIKPQEIIEGIAQTKWPGRLELLATKPAILLDGGHNVAGIKTLVLFLAEWLSNTKTPFTRRTLIFSAMQDKDIRSMAEILFPLFDEVILVLRDDVRAANFAQHNFSSFAKRINTVEGESAALAAAEAITPQDGLIVATGSLHLVGALKKIMDKGCSPGL